MKKYLVDVPVLLKIFIRPEKLKKCFEVIKKARPSKLFIMSDGPREDYPTDLGLIQQCRKIVEDIDWECEVHRIYLDENVGMLASGRQALEYTFKYVDRLVFLEDDIVVSESFFKFCAEMLEKYKDDLRINMICGNNILGEYEEPESDYFFTDDWSIWGFAFWKRTFDLFHDYEFKNDQYTYDRVLEHIKANKILYDKNYDKVTKVNTDGIYNDRILGTEFWLFMAIILNNQLNIMASRNMVSNIGYGFNSTHSNKELLEMRKSARRLFNMKRYELDFPLKHPKYVVNDKTFAKKVDIALFRQNALAKFIAKAESKYRTLRYGNLKDAIRRKISILNKRKRENKKSN